MNMKNESGTGVRVVEGAMGVVLEVARDIEWPGHAGLGGREKAP